MEAVRSETITISVEGDFTLPVEDVFPDGAPDGWTVADVVAVLRESGNSPALLLAEWGLGPLDVSVSVARPVGRHRYSYEHEKVWP